MKNSKNLLTQLLLLFYFLKVQHSHYFSQQILSFKLLFIFYLKITIIIFLPSIINCNNLLFNINCKNIVKNIIKIIKKILFFSFFIYFFI